MQSQPIEGLELALEADREQLNIDYQREVRFLDSNYNEDIAFMNRAINWFEEQKEIRRGTYDQEYLAIRKKYGY